MKKWFVILFAVPTVLLVGLLLTSTQWMKFGLEKGLPGIQVELERGGINLLNGRVELTELVFQREKKPVLHLSNLVLDLSMDHLFKQQFVLDQLRIADGELWAEQLKSGGWRLAGVDLSSAPGPGKTPTSEPKPQEQEAATDIDALGVGFAELLLEKLTVHLQEGGRNRTVYLQEIQVNSPGLLQTKSQLALLLKVGMGPASVDVTGKVTPFDVPIHFDGDLKLKGISLALAKPYADAIPASLEGQLSSDLGVNLNYSPQADSIFKIDGGITLSHFSLQQDALDLKLPSTTWNGSIQTTLAADSAVHANLDGAFEVKQIQVQQSGEQPLLAGVQSLAWNGKIKADLPIDAPPTGLLTGELKSQGVGFERSGIQQPITGGVDALSWKGSVTQQGGEGDLQVHGISGEMAGEKPAVMNLGFLHVDGVKFDLSQKVGVAGISLANLNLLMQGQSAPLLAVDGIGLKSLHYDPAGRVTLDQATVSGSQVRLHRDVTGQWPWSVQAQSNAETVETGETEQSVQAESARPGAEKAADVVAESSASDSSFSYQLGGLTFLEGIQFSLYDEGVEPVVNMSGQITELSLGSLDSLAPEQETPFKLVGEVGEKGTFDFAGYGKPLLSDPDVLIKGFVKAVSLPPFSPYVVPELGYQFSSGSLDIYGDMKLAKNEIKAENKLTLKMFKMDSANTDKSAEIAKKLPLSMDSALDLLRDGNGDIEIKLPVTGPMDAPNVDFNDAIGKVMGKVSAKAAKTTAIAALGPFGLALSALEMVGSAAIEAEEQRNLAPLLFSAGSATLTESGRQRLDQLATYLGTKKGRRITACGKVVSADEPILAAMDNQTFVAQQFSTAKATSIKPAALVTTDARQRSQGVAGYTVRVSSFKSLSRAEKARKIWRERGYDALIRELPGREGVRWQAVSVGQFANRAEALALVETLRQNYQVEGVLSKSQVEISMAGTVAETKPVDVPVATIPVQQGAAAAGKFASVEGAAAVVALSDRMLGLAKSRSAVVIEYLTVSANVALDRVFGCLPVAARADDEQGPRVEFSF
ncbi:MAG: DUF748 domain-containing protein [Magnetococcales bacterium]|nr:DUF748 domain-containing protein [Magnetococcales bacterium]